MQEWFLHKRPACKTVQAEQIVVAGVAAVQIVQISHFPFEPDYLFSCSYISTVVKFLWSRCGGGKWLEFWPDF